MCVRVRRNAHLRITYYVKARITSEGWNKPVHLTAVVADVAAAVAAADAAGVADLADVVAAAAADVADVAVDVQRS